MKSCEWQTSTTEWLSGGSALDFSQADMPHLRNRLAYLILQRGELELGRMEQEEAASRLDDSTVVAVPIPSSSRGSLLDGPSRLLCVVMGRRQFKYTLLTAAGPLRQKFSRSDLEVVEDQQAGARGFPADLGILANLHPIETLAEAASAVRVEARLPQPRAVGVCFFACCCYCLVIFFSGEACRSSTPFDPSRTGSLKNTKQDKLHNT
mmetsp:Transcript_14149/g.22313  ORF Transcript_14149/g.22313 Transcript_14149/m.22313 type:complete len:208 (-) Transcript_14149:46-669(-)